MGQDIGLTPGFTVVSLNGSWQSDRGLRIAAGVDNLLDELYAEHVSRGCAAVAGYVQTTRINEPARTLWLRAAIGL